MNIGETITVTYEESKKLRKEGWRPRNDVVVMMYVGNPKPPSIHERGIRGRCWTQADHNLANRKMAEESRPLVIKRKHRRRKRATENCGAPKMVTAPATIHESAAGI